MIELDYKAAEIFLKKSAIKNYQIKKIAGDASFRSYYRIFFSDENVSKTLILMFAPPQYEDVKPFVKIAQFLVLNQFSAPKIFFCSEESGLLLLEDLGDDTFTRVLASQQSQELELYKKACDCLLELHRVVTLDGVEKYNHAVLFREVMLFVDWYLLLQKKSITLQEKARFKFLWFQLFDLLNKEDQTLVLRDYHADNLIILPKREAHKKVGLLDFQDALIGSKAYDLVSLLEDARRDVSEENRVKIFEHYLANANCDEAQLRLDYAILSLQRNIKIIGIFARLSLRDGKHNYLDFLPRVLSLVKLRLESDKQIFGEISQLIKKFI